MSLDPSDGFDDINDYSEDIDAVAATEQGSSYDYAAAAPGPYEYNEPSYILDESESMPDDDLKEEWAEDWKDEWEEEWAEDWKDEWEEPSDFIYECLKHYYEKHLDMRKARISRNKQLLKNLDKFWETDPDHNYDESIPEGYNVINVTLPEDDIGLALLADTGGAAYAARLALSARILTRSHIIQGLLLEMYSGSQSPQQILSTIFNEMHDTSARMRSKSNFYIVTTMHLDEQLVSDFIETENAKLLTSSLRNYISLVSQKHNLFKRCKKRGTRPPVIISPDAHDVPLSLKELNEYMYTIKLLWNYIYKSRAAYIVLAGIAPLCDYKDNYNVLRTALCKASFGWDIWRTTKAQFFYEQHETVESNKISIYITQSSYDVFMRAVNDAGGLERFSRRAIYAYTGTAYAKTRDIILRMYQDKITPKDALLECINLLCFGYAELRTSSNKSIVLCLRTAFANSLRIEDMHATIGSDFMCNIHLSSIRNETHKLLHSSLVERCHKKGIFNPMLSLDTIPSGETNAQELEIMLLIIGNRWSSICTFPASYTLLHAIAMYMDPIQANKNDIRQAIVHASYGWDLDSILNSK